MKSAKTVMIQGTGSGVGKSVIACALCRIFRQDGFSVAPFKAQNMALNSFVTEDGGEIGRAQAVQALACWIKPTVDINPVLVKPSSDRLAQVIVHGKSVGNMSVYDYKRFKGTVFGKIKKSFKNLSQRYEVVVIEGAGSPAEVNLKSHDLVNMRIAKLARSPVILVGDIDKGGVFAWLIGTLELLTQEEKAMVKGFIINKFRGDKRLLMPGLRFLEKRTGIKVLGVIPYYSDIKIPEEDSVPLEARTDRAGSDRKINISVVSLPHMSNFDDFDSLEREPDVSLRYVNSCGELAGSDVIILPGTKNTIEDLAYLKRKGITRKIEEIFNAKPKTRIVGICGGYQMLGVSIRDGKGVESKSEGIKGLGVLSVATALGRGKILSQVRAIDLGSGIEVTGYEIHHGRTRIIGDTRHALEIVEFKNKPAVKPDGAVSDDGRCWGTYVHGIFDNDKFRRNFLNGVRSDKGWAAIGEGASHNPDAEIDRLSALVRKNMDLNELYKITFGIGYKIRQKRRI